MTSANHLQMQCKLHYREEQWVDFLLGNLSNLQRQQLEAHLIDCQACRLQVEQWGELLTDQEEFIWHKDSVKQAVTHELSEKRLLSLHRQVKKQANWLRLKKQASHYKYALAGAVAAVLLLVALPFTFHGVKSSISNLAHVDQYVQAYEPDAFSFVNAANSARYRIETAEGEASSGYIWLKDDWSEAFLWLENLQQIGLNDYQAWAISGEQASSLGIIQLVGSEGHLYMNAPLLKPTDFITLTVEPKGGSLAPTSRQMVLIVKQK